MKIVFCTNSICSLGGIEVITIVKANALAQIPGNQVWIVVPDHDGSPILPLKNVNLVNLAIHFYENDYKGKIHATIDMMKKRHLYRQRCKEALSNIQPAVIISTGLMPCAETTRLKSSMSCFDRFRRTFVMHFLLHTEVRSA